MTFATEIFHPLLVPLTTYTFSTNVSDANGTVSARDEERLTPGGFSLRNGFPQWFDRRGRAAQEIMDTDAPYRQNGLHSRIESRGVSVEPPPESVLAEATSPSQPSHEANTEPTSITEVLSYLKAIFEDPALLDKLPLEAAANPGAWHAWRSHRRFSKGTSRAISPANDEQSNPPTDGGQTLPRDWNWDGVWENRVKIGIENSLSDPVLFGPKSGRGGDKRNEMVSAAVIAVSLIADSHRYDFLKWAMSSWITSVTK